MSEAVWAARSGTTMECSIWRLSGVRSATTFLLERFDFCSIVGIGSSGTPWERLSRGSLETPIEGFLRICGFGGSVTTSAVQVQRVRRGGPVTLMQYSQSPSLWKSTNVWKETKPRCRRRAPLVFAVSGGCARVLGRRPGFPCRGPQTAYVGFRFSPYRPRVRWAACPGMSGLVETK